MGSVISITNMKGGVGKTTLTANIGYCLSFIHDKNILLIDIDPQFNLTQYCMGEAEYESIKDDRYKGTVFDILVPDSMRVPQFLKKKNKSKKITYIYNIRKGLDLIPSSMQLIDFIDQRSVGSERLLANFIRNIKNDYDFILLDCPPTSTILSRAAYLASDAYLIPMGMDYFSVMGVPLLQKDINDFSERFGVTMKGLGIIKSKYLDWTTVAHKHKNIVEQFSRQLNIKIFDASFQQRQEVQNALAERKFLIEHNNNSSSSTDIKNITEELINEAARLGV